MSYRKPDERARAEALQEEVDVLKAQLLEARKEGRHRVLRFLTNPPFVIVLVGGIAVAAATVMVFRSPKSRQPDPSLATPPAKPSDFICRYGLTVPSRNLKDLSLGQDAQGDRIACGITSDGPSDHWGPVLCWKVTTCP